MISKKSTLCRFIALTVLLIPACALIVAGCASAPALSMTVNSLECGSAAPASVPAAAQTASSQPSPPAQTA